MTRINIDLLCKIAEDFEEAIPPPPVTLPSGAIPPAFKDRSVQIGEESISPLARSVFEKEMSVRTIKDLISKFNHIFSLSRGAVGILSTMKRDMILHPTLGLDNYLEPINDEVNKIYAIVGKKPDPSI